MTSTAQVGLFALVCALACACRSQPTSVAVAQVAMNRPLPSTDGSLETLYTLLQRHEWIVLLFYSDTCPTVKAHDERVKALAERYAERGVGFYWVDSEVGTSPTRAKASAQLRGYSLPILVDSDAHLADALGARYASHAFILSATGRVAYSGGIDSDKRVLHADATPYLADALDSVLTGIAPTIGDSRALGCALQR